jgi:diguanylate cyclase (GGDEF)-like protein
MKDGKTDDRWHGLNLKDALRVLRHAGRPDPTEGGGSVTEQLQAIIDSLCHLSLHDGLTGLVNSTFFRATLAREIDRSSRTDRSLGLLVLDVDNFKTINDTRGHLAGDAVLQQLAGQLRMSLRAMDTPARIGGDEFAVILPECDALDAICAGVRIHGMLNPLDVRIGDECRSVSVSAGLVWTEPGATITVEQLIAQADDRLYRAKESGRARLCYPTLITTQVSGDERVALSLSRHKEGSYGQ